MDDRFIQIAVSAKHSLYALDNAGFIWRYIPAKHKEDGSTQYAFWSRLTRYRAKIRTDEPPKESKQ